MTAMQKPHRILCALILELPPVIKTFKGHDRHCKLLPRARSRIASWYVENQSGAKVDCELLRLLEDCHCGDVLLVEQVDRLTRLNKEDWVCLPAILQAGVGGLSGFAHQSCCYDYSRF